MQHRKTTALYIIFWLITGFCKMGDVNGFRLTAGAIRLAKSGFRVQG